jgi:putative membrane protein
MIKKFLRPFLVTGLTLALLAWLLPNISVTDWTTIVVAAVVFTLVNLIVKPVLKLLTLPINILTLGIFSVFLNIGLLMLSLWLVPGFVVTPLTIGGVQLTQFMTLIVLSILIGLGQSVVGIFI